jgi:hypothetical protein
LRIWSRALIAALVITAGVVACSSDEPGGGGEQLGIEDGAGAGVAKTFKVDGSVQKTLTLDTGASLTVPKGALDREVTIGVERPSDEKAVELVKSLKSVKSVASAPYVLTPHGTKFNSAVTLALPISKNADRKLVVGWLEDEEDTDWKVLADAKVESGVVKVNLTHFSVVVVLDAEEAGLDTSTLADGGSSDASAADAGVTRDAAIDAPDADKPVDPQGTSDAGSSSTDAEIKLPPDANADDAGVSSDASTSTDASITLDAGVDDDAFVPLPDAAIDDDAFVPPRDASVDDDAFVPPPDAGVDDDASLPADSGPVDAAQDSETGPADAADEADVIFIP